MIERRQRFAIALQRHGFAEAFPSEVARSIYLDAIEEVYGRKTREKAEGEIDSAPSELKITKLVGVIPHDCEGGVGCAFADLEHIKPTVPDFCNRCGGSGRGEKDAIDDKASACSYCKGTGRDNSQ